MASTQRTNSSTKKREERGKRQGSRGNRQGVQQARTSIRDKVSSSKIFSVPAPIMGPRLLLIGTVAILCVFGLVMIYSASSINAFNKFGDASYYFDRQIFFAVIGTVACVIFAFIPYSFWRNWPVFLTLWVISSLLLSMTAFGMGVSALGAERSIIIAGFALQPAEFAKIAVLLAAASLISIWREGGMTNRRFGWVIAVAVAIPLFLIYRQPDLGTAIILVIGLLTMAILAGLPWSVIGGAMGVLIAYVVFACVTQPYHLERIMTMLDPWLDPQDAGYQTIQSLYAFGSGGLLGTGLGLSRQKYLYLPEAHTDFIFSIIGEELGLIGALFVVVLFALFAFAGMRIARSAPDLFGCLVAASMAVMIVFQAGVNMGSVTGVAPVTGKPMPFLSYGGSSLIATLSMVGIILSVSIHSKMGASNERRRDNLVVIEGRDARAGNRTKRAGNESSRRGTREKDSGSARKLLSSASERGEEKQRNSERDAFSRAARARSGRGQGSRTASKGYTERESGERRGRLSSSSGRDSRDRASSRSSQTRRR